jgi:hypothetical protein
MKYLIKLPLAILLLLGGALISWIAIGYGWLTPMNVGDKGNAYGRFVNMPPVISLNDDGRTSILQKDIVFIDPRRVPGLSSLLSLAQNFACLELATLVA